MELPFLPLAMGKSWMNCLIQSERVPDPNASQDPDHFHQHEESLFHTKEDFRQSVYF